VRLKAALKDKSFATTIISIPSGAIKRRNYLFTSNEDISFQFLLVRLKELEQQTKLTELQAFQFLLVRLKALSANYYPIHYLDFNSFWCD